MILCGTLRLHLQRWSINCLTWQCNSRPTAHLGGTERSRTRHERKCNAQAAPDGRVHKMVPAAAVSRVCGACTLIGALNMASSREPTARVSSHVGMVVKFTRSETFLGIGYWGCSPGNVSLHATHCDPHFMRCCIRGSAYELATVSWGPMSSSCTLLTDERITHTRPACGAQGWPPPHLAAPRPGPSCFCCCRVAGSSLMACTSGVSRGSPTV
jgi:hypothetical protein